MEGHSSSKPRNNRRKKSGTIIHTTIRSTKNRSHHARSLRDRQSAQAIVNRSIQSSSYLTTIQKIRPFKSSIVVPSQLNTSTCANPTDYAGNRDPLPNQKKKFVRGSCLIVILFTILILMAVMITLLVILLNKPKTIAKPAAIPTLRWKPDAITIAGGNSTPGTAANQLYHPYHVAIDYTGTIYIADQGNNRIQKYLQGATSGSTVAGLSNGTTSNMPYGLYQPSQTIVDSNQNLYITDAGNQRVQFWVNGESFGKTIAGAGGYGNASNQFYLPYGAAYDPATSAIYIADYGNNRVMSYASGASSGAVVAGGNGVGLNNTQLNYPCGLYFDSFTNSLIIGNNLANNIVRWKVGDDHWTFLAGSTQGIRGNTSALLSSPGYLTLDPMGNLYVADTNNQRIQLFLNGQSNGTTIAGVTGVSGNNTNLLYRPVSAELDGQLNLYIADTYNNRIQKFSRY